jgi:hypothetical protein
MKKLLPGAVLFFISVSSLFAQGEIDDQKTTFYRNERTFGLLLNTDGFGLSYREGLRIDFRNKKLYEIDLGLFRHPREVKLSNPWYQSGSTFVFGKLNSVFFLRGGLGRQHEIFTKEDLGGVAIRYFFSAGPEISVSQYYFEIKEEKFEESIHHPGDIYSKASFLKGIKEISIIPGVYAKGGFNFEYSRQDKVIHAIELGTALNLFPKKITIMASDDNRAIFFSLFVSYRMGLIIDPFDPQSNRISTIFIRNR